MSVYHITLNIANRIPVLAQREYIEKYLSEKDWDLTTTLDGEAAYRDADFVIIAAPSNYDSKRNYFGVIRDGS